MPESELRVRKNVRFFRRDTYLNRKVTLNSAFSPIDCAEGHSQWGPSLKARDAARKFVVDEVSVYPVDDLFYDRLLKPVILRRFQMADEARELLFFGHGSFNLAERLIHKLIEPMAMLGVGPQFNEIPSEFLATGGKYQPILLESPRFDFPLDAVQETLQRGDFSVMYLDNPNNPLGSLLELEQVSLIVQTAKEVGTIVIVDEAYGDFVEDRHSAVRLIADFPNLAVLRSCSKGLGLAAERVGYMFLSRELAEIYRELDVPFEPSLYAATLGSATLGDDDYRRWLRGQVLSLKSVVMNVLGKARYLILPTHPSVSIMTIHKEGVEVVEEMEGVGIKVEPGSCFSKTHVGWDNTYCRLRVPKSEDLEEFCRRIENIAGR
ncbi:MAG: aminotransferase class I/II-fold pyridoxal phosphate-dependent enzyme [Candidatus Magasanikbacteria bacterium]|nr:aminotransferase class I/II-fold pyridoxal phosphate-dependent enzyme [Candidatus Magasanikbacteria bacterium]